MYDDGLYIAHTLMPKVDSDWSKLFPHSCSLSLPGACWLLVVEMVTPSSKEGEGGWEGELLGSWSVFENNAYLL